MVKTVLYAEKLYDNDKVEREVFGPDVRVESAQTMPAAMVGPRPKNVITPEMF
jgi:hypothetical protein